MRSPSQMRALFAILLTQAPGRLRYLCELYPALVYAAL